MEDTITEDCKLWEKLFNKDKMMYSCLHLNVCSNSEETGLYELILNGWELYYGTLREINAVVKTMIRLIDKADKYGI